MPFAGTAAAISTLLAMDGHKLNEAGNPSRELKSRYGNHSVYTKFEDTDSIGTFTCTKKIRPQKIFISEKLSTCMSIYVDKDVDRLYTYDSLLGIDYDAYTKGRQFILVADETEVLDASLPASGDSYTSKEVLFCGYNKPGGAIDFNSVRLTHEWVGIEELLNEVKISGIYTNSVNSETETSTRSLSSARCIFNEDGNKDRSQITESSEIGGAKYFFNKSGIGQTEFWSCKNILLYIKWFYCTANSPIIALDSGDRGLNLINYISNYINIDFERMNETDLPDIDPMNLDLEGMGVLDAIKKVLKESKKYMLYKAYRCDGKVTIGYRSKIAVTTTERFPEDNPMLFRIGVQGASTASTNLVNAGNINLNRETKNVGRVIVLGDYLRINTLCTSLAYSTFASNLSSDPDTYSAVAGLTTFTDRLALVLTATHHLETWQQNYQVIPTNMLSVALSDIGANMTTYNGESTSLKIFDGLKCLEFSREFIVGGVTEVEGKKVRDMGCFIALPSTPYDYNGTDYIQALRYDDTNYYYYITPLESVQNNFSLKHEDKKNRSAIILCEANGGKDNINADTGKTPFGEYQYSSIVPYFNIAIRFFDGYDDSNPVPLFIRTNVRTDYRIKGIAQIAGYDSDIHSTEIVEDMDFKLSINYKDATYDGAGNFTNVTNGFINADDDLILQKIQAKAEALLEKYTVIQNSGFVDFNGYQNYIKVGDWSDKFTGSGRDINTPVVVNTITFDLTKKLTTVAFGS